MLIQNFGDEVGELAFAVLYGDKTFVSDKLLNVFKFSGVVHLFAVSGLHVGLIVAILYFLLKKLKANDIVNFPILGDWDFQFIIRLKKLMVLFTSTEQVGRRSKGCNDREKSLYPFKL